MRPRVPHLVPLLPFLSFIASSQAAPTSDVSSFATDSSSVILPASAAGQSEAPSTSSVASSSSPSYLASSTESSGSSTSTLASVASVESYSPPVTTSAAAASSGAVTVTVTETVTAVSAAPTATAFSPPFYPTPETQGEGAWADAVAKAKSALSSWTVEQKVNLTTGVGWQNGRCVGNIAAQPDVGFPGLCLEDAPLGVRFADFVSVFPAGVNAAATFDRDLMRARGLAIAQEHRGKGVNVALGPGVNLARLSQAGRSWEMAGADPFLAGEVAYETIKGMQTPGKGVQACVKHYIGNELERNRTEASSNIDDRTMHELYLHPFLRAVQADVASVMCSYNQINGSWACQNSKTQNDLLKTELGFQGYIMSDWQATESGVSAVLAGLDMSMPGDIVFGARTPSGELSTYFGHNLTAAVSNGSVPLERVDDMATRILSAWYLLEQDGEYPEVNFDFRNTNNPDTNEHVDVQDDHYKLIRQIGAASTVLLKNDNGALPLGGLRTIALIGDDAGPSSRGPNGYADRGGLDGTLAQGWGSGTAEYPYLISPLEAIQSKARENRTTVSWFLNNYDLAGAATAAAYKDVALVFIAADSGEGYITVDGNEGDRKNLTAWANGDELVLATAAVNNNTIVVVHSVGPIIMEPWIEHPNVTAVVWAGLPGQESGNSLVDVLWGAYNPSAKLPYTIAKSPSDYGIEPNFVNTAEPPHPQIDYTEKLNIDYRHFLQAGIEPRYGFGYGLSYTQFGYANLAVVPTSSKSKRDEWQSESSFNGTDGNQLAGVKIGTSVDPALHAQRFSVEFTVTNTGPVDGCDVPQLYLAFPEAAGEPPKVLRGFERHNLQPGASVDVRYALSWYDLSIWDVVTQKWTVPEGEFRVVIGQSAFDEQLEMSFTP